jgi:hypothetical protein
MALLSTTTRGKLSLKTAAAAVKNPGARRLVSKTVAPAAKVGVGYRKAQAKRRARKRAWEVGRTARMVGEVLLVKTPEAAQELGLIERPAPKRTAPRVMVGMALGAGATYLLLERAR